MKLLELINVATSRKASDIHLTVGLPPVLRIDGQLIILDSEKLTANDTKMLVYESLNDNLINILEKKGEVDSSFSSPRVGRYRINAYKQRGSFGMALRIIPLDIPTVEELGLPLVVRDLARLPRGLVLVTGPTGSGKSTTLASMINQINSERTCHILTLEDPIEYLHKHNKSIVNQREIGTDSLSFANGLRSALRQDPDVILVGEMRDLETMSIALTAAETGHLVFSTLHTVGTAKTIDRVIDVFPPHQQQQVRTQFASAIQAIVSQQLLPKSNESGRIAAFEIMIATAAIRNLIREEKTHQVDTAIQTGSKYQMQTMDNSILELYKKGLISKETALMQAINQDNIKKYIT
ncbi:type IV pilus twitching motility protein PilT [Tissierella sp.]|uniref:type IV pilus twitching motility protein PilT n=1 Tax=Tissierella sp. TaxID=41274 RepID=UPI002858ACD1|nr:type IV pilus twitching motility protein PilT [Tissierella sp.]MDR7856121.1 type IV pilus twitching motility protein PilT [Tissierella sp.]